MSTSTSTQIAVNRWLITLEQDEQTGELILPLDSAILQQTGWVAGDTLIWSLSTDESGQIAILTKKTSE